MRCDTADGVFDGPKSAAVADGAALVAGFCGVGLDALRVVGTGLPGSARTNGAEGLNVGADARSGQLRPWLQSNWVSSQQLMLGVLEDVLF